jgi:plasmid stabilization system protein ParE
MQIDDEDEPPKKPARPTLRCEEMLNEIVTYIAADSPRQAEIMYETFYETLKILETMPGIGTKYKDGMRKCGLGKFRRYNIYYREQESIIEILGIWHTSLGTEFEESVF